MRIVFFGTPQFAVPSLKRLLDHPDFEVLAVVTQPDKRRGRGGKVTPSAVKAAVLAQASNQASDQDCPIWQPKRIKKDLEIQAKLNALQADAFVVIAYGQILSSKILHMPRLGCVNAHGSILPKYRGAAPIQWCIHNGASATGVTTMLMDAGMDTGPMLLKETIPISLTDNAWKIAEKLSLLSADLLPATIEALQQQVIRPVAQNNEQATYAPLIQKQDYWLDWDQSSKAIHDKVRGFYPSCTTRFRDSDLKVIETLPVGEEYWPQLPASWRAVEQSYQAAGLSHLANHDTPGTIVSILKNYGPIVQTGDGHLLINEVKPAGKKSLSGWDFANGSRLKVGERLGL